jgi:hypothetical protein
MSQTASTLLLRNLHDVFGEIDPVRRRAAIDEIFHEDAVFYEPNGAYRGRDEIDRIAGVIKATHPDFQYQPLSTPEEIGDGCRVRGCRAALASRQLTPEPISQSSGTARLPPSISSLTSFLELDRHPGPPRRPMLASSSATPTGRRLPMCISRKSQDDDQRPSCSPATRRGASP